MEPLELDVVVSLTEAEIRGIVRDEVYALLRRKPRGTGRPSLLRIQKAVAEFYGITYEQMVGPRRTQDLVQARHVAMFLSRSLGKASYPQIGKAFLRDHTTAIWGFQQVSRGIKRDGGILADIQEIERRLAA